MKNFLLATSLLLATACAHQQVSVTTPITPPASGEVSNDTRAPTSANTIDPVYAHQIESDTTHRPAWLEARIAVVLAERKRNPITRILRYQYEGQAVYYISAPCCDQFSEVFDTKGNLICHPDGGITGKGDGKCRYFEKRKTNEKLVWQDPR